LLWRPTSLCVLGCHCLLSLSIASRTLRLRAVRAKPPFVSCLRRASLPCRRDEGRPAPSQPARCPPWVASSQPRHVLAVIRHRVNSVFCSHSATPALSPAPPIPPDCTPSILLLMLLPSTPNALGCISARWCQGAGGYRTSTPSVVMVLRYGMVWYGSGPAPPCTFLLLCCRWEFCAPAP